MTFDEWWKILNTRGLPNIQRYKVVCKMAYTEGQKHGIAQGLARRHGTTHATSTTAKL